LFFYNLEDRFLHGSDLLFASGSMMDGYQMQPFLSWKQTDFNGGIMRPDRRTIPLTLHRFLKRYVKSGLILGFVSLVVGGAIAFGLYAGALSTNHDRAGNRANMEKALYSYGTDAHDLSPVMLEKRKAAAQKIVDVEERAKKFGIYDDTFTNYEQGQIAAVALTGQPLQLDTNKWTFTAYYHTVYGPIGLLSMWAFFGLCGLISWIYQRDDHGEDYRFADLPWQERWPFIVIFAMGPVVWATVGISALHLRGDPPVPEEELAPLPPVVLPDDEWYAPTEERTPTPQRPRKSYLNAPHAAQICYTRIRTTAASEYRRRHVANLKEEIEYAQSDAQMYSENLRIAQRTINQLRADRQRIEQALATEQPPVDAKAAAEEFDRIMRLPGIIATQVVNDRLRLIIRASIRYNKRTYDLGDWEIDIGADTRYIKASCVRSGLNPGWRNGSYPAYRLGDGSFCFGDRTEVIDEHLIKGQYLEAVALAVECLNGVNKEHRSLIPEAFKPIIEKKEVEGEPIGDTVPAVPATADTR
jgi:hypothetical protein